MSGHCKRFVITGRVQGVFYRVATCRKALELDVTGHAKNLPDGSVEVLACGSVDALNALEEWLWEGPPSARVDEVIPEQMDCDTPTDFRAA